MGDHYSIEFPAFAIQMTVDRLRRDRNELVGELTVKCGLPGALTVNGCLSSADFNFSSVRARQDRAKLLKERAKTNGSVDWFGIVEEFSQKVFEGERAGDPAVDLRTLPRPERDDEIHVDNLYFPRRHPSILFGDGGSAKSYVGLYLAGTLATRGMSVGLFDWELGGEDHRDRLERIFGNNMPLIQYVRCERSLVSEADRLSRLVREAKIQYAIFDSISFSCNGRPEDAEIAAQYFRAVRGMACGSLHIAHVNRSEENDKKPFGSSFWHNGARCTWFVKAVDSDADNGTLRIGCFNRKANLGPLHPATGYLITFRSNKTIFTPAEPAEHADLADKMTVRQRMHHLLRTGARTVPEIASQIDAKADTIERTMRRYKTDFVVIDGGLVGLKGKAS